MMIYSDILSNRECKRRFSHGRTTRNNHQVRLLPATCNAIQFGISRRYSRQITCVSGCLLQDFRCLGYHRINLRIVLLHVGLRQREEVTFGFLHQLIYILRLIKRLGFDDTGIRNQLTSQRFLRKYFCMILDVG